MASLPPSDSPPHPTISITPLLTSLLSNHPVSPSEISATLSLSFQNALSPTQCASLLTLLASSKLDRDPLVLAQCASSMREAATPLNASELRAVIRERDLKEGTYRGGLVDIVGTGGDGHSVFNVSTSASILCSSLLLVAKHGNRASSSTSGSADLIQSLPFSPAPDIEATTAARLPKVYTRSNYAFLFAPRYHTGMRHVASIRKDLGFRTIFNLLGPLANPAHAHIEARIVGVASQDLLPVFAEALRQSKADKCLVVCGAENLDEISCAGVTHCKYVVKRPNPHFRGAGKEKEDDNSTTSDDEETEPRLRTQIESFELSPTDFGLGIHPLTSVSPGKQPRENAELLMKLLRNELAPDDPVLEFVLLNAAALFAVSGVCEAEGFPQQYGDGEAAAAVIKERGPGGLRWKEGVRRARWSIASGAALRALEAFVSCTRI
ncbi:MAG: hypothetical protein Q9191_008291 [Dirinaria sp. TL-2023a]